jgi:hypothetical protein
MTLEWDARSGGEVLTSLHSAGLQLTAKRTAEALKNGAIDARAWPGRGRKRGCGNWVASLPPSRRKPAALKFARDLSCEHVHSRIW